MNGGFLGVPDRAEAVAGLALHTASFLLYHASMSGTVCHRHAMLRRTLPGWLSEATCCLPHDRRAGSMLPSSVLRTETDPRRSARPPTGCRPVVFGTDKRPASVTLTDAQNPSTRTPAMTGALLEPVPAPELSRGLAGDRATAARPRRFTRAGRECASAHDSCRWADALAGSWRRLNLGSARVPVAGTTDLPPAWLTENEGHIGVPNGRSLHD
jgi:hypothetical protein